LDTGRYDRALTPIIGQIEKGAVRAASRGVITQNGGINYNNPFAQDLLPGLTDLAISELIRLKVTRAFAKLRSRFPR